MGLSASSSCLLRSTHHERRLGQGLFGICLIALSALYTGGLRLAAGQPITLSAPSLELLAAMPREVTGIAGADDAAAIITAARAMPLLGIARRFGYLTATETAWSKLEGKLELRGTGHSVLLHGPLVIGMAKDGEDGFVMLTGLSTDAAALLRSKLEAVPTELVEGRPILSIERDGLRMAILDTPAWLQRPKNIATVLPFVAVLAPPTQRGPELLRSAVKLLSTPQQREQRSGAVIASKLSAASLPEFAEVTRLGQGKQGWAAHRAQPGNGDGAGSGWAAALGIEGRTIKLSALLQEQAKPAEKAAAAEVAKPPAVTRPVWLAKRPPLQEPSSADVGLLVEQIDRGAMEALPAPLSWLVISLPVAEQSSVFAAIEQLPGPGGKPVFGATGVWVLPQRAIQADAGDEPLARTTPRAPGEVAAAVGTTLAMTATAADATMTDAATRLERYGKAEAAAAPPALAQMGLRPEAVRELRLSMDPATLAGRITGSRTVISWRAIELAGSEPAESANIVTGVVARLWPAGSGGSGNANSIPGTGAGGQTRQTMLRWTWTPLPLLPLIPAASQPPDGTENPPLPTSVPLPLEEDVISQGLLRPGVLSPMIEAPGQTGFADIVRTIELFRWRITAVPLAGRGADVGSRRRIEIEMRQAGGKEAGGK